MLPTNSSRTITAYPEPRLSGLIGSRGGFAENLGQFTTLHTSGRAALYAAFCAIRNVSKAPIWMPAFHCGVEVQAAIDADLSIHFYPIGIDLDLRLSSFLDLWNRNPGHVLLVHYFGFGQSCSARLREELSRRGFLLIEDCAHSLFSKQGEHRIGEYAPISIFSLRKTLPLFHGGALRFHAGAWETAGYRAPAVPALRPSSGQVLLQIAKQEAMRLAGPGAVSKVRKLRGKPPLNDGSLFPPCLDADPFRNEQISPVSRWLAARASEEVVVDKRRRNYLWLERELFRIAKVKPVFDHLPDGVCPLCLPVTVSDRQRFLCEVQKANISPFIFGAYAHPLLPAGLRSTHHAMRDEIVGVPIHQQLSAEDMERIVRTVGPLLQDAVVNIRKRHAQIAS